jgi:type I restriction enzyme S subunit
MELMKGYKQTEVGVIPEEWKLMTIDQIFEFHSTSNFSKAQMFTDGEIGCLHYGLIHSLPNNNYNIQNGVKYFVTKQQAKYEFIKEGDVIMVDASEDLSGVNKSIEISGIKDKLYISGLHTYLLRDRGFFEKYFRGQILNSYFTKAQFYRLAVGMKVFGVSKQQLKTVLLPIPTKSEQIAIANALSDADAYITSLEKLIDKKRQIKQGAMQDLLKPRVGWKIKKLSDFLVYEQPGSYIVKSTDYNDNYQTPVLTAGKSFILGFTNEEFGIFKNAPVIIFDDFTTSTKYVDFDFKVKSSAMKILHPKDKDVNLKFIFEIMQTIDYPMGIGDHKRHWIGSYQNIEVKVPSIEIQNQISIILSDMDEEISVLIKKRDKIKSNKQGMMQNLLNGKIRLI